MNFLIRILIWCQPCEVGRCRAIPSQRDGM
ncbi:MAG: hypothetical protein RLZZ232_1781 [Planctomycetota bacterium]